MKARTNRWVSLPPEVDKKVQAQAKLEGRSISNLLRRIINKNYDYEEK